MPDTTSNAQQGSEKPVLLDAIEFTVRTIEERMRFYRYLVRAICAVALASICLALVFRHFVVLAGFGVIVPLVGGCFYLDSRGVRLWRAGILELSRLRGLKVRDFCHTTSQLRYLPAGTLKGMLATLGPDLASVDGKSPTDEQAVLQDLLAARMRSHEREILFATGLLTLALIGLTGAAIYRSITFLLCAAGCLLVLALLRRRWRK